MVPHRIIICKNRFFRIFQFNYVIFFFCCYVKGTIENIRKSENYEFDEKTEKINLNELKQKDNNDNSKEISEKKENNFNFFKYVFGFIVVGFLLYLFFKKDENKKGTEENTEITESKQKTTLKDFKENFLKNQNK